MLNIYKYKYNAKYKTNSNKYKINILTCLGPIPASGTTCLTCLGPIPLVYPSIEIQKCLKSEALL